MNFNDRIVKPLVFPQDDKLHSCQLVKAELDSATFPIDLIISEPNLPYECYIKDLVENSDGALYIKDDGNDKNLIVFYYTHNALIESARKCKQVQYE